MLLLTLGCSWTRGIGSGYYPGLTKFEFTNTDIARRDSINDRYSFRGLISQKYNLENQNFSVGGSSNEEQFFRLSEIFGNDSKRKNILEKKPIVLWGITSTARIFRNNQSYILNSITPGVMRMLDETRPNDEELKSLLQDQMLLYEALYYKLFYKHSKSIDNLEIQINFWNTIFENYNIPVLWFDTFNTHEYKTKLKNFLPNGDLLTQMLELKNVRYKKTSTYHFSRWKVDDPRIIAGVKSGLLNPFSYHPTKLGHEIIAEILDPYIKELINNKNKDNL